MKLSRLKLNPVSSLLRGGKTNLLIALVMAVGMIAALSIFAAGGQLAHPNCPEPVTKWAFNLGWKNPDTFTCKPDFSKHKVDALPGSVAEQEFSKIKNTRDLKQFLNSNNEKAELFRKSAKQAMDGNSYNAWLSGDHFVMVQFKKPAVIKGNSYLAGGKIEYNDSHLRPVAAGDILFVFVDPTKKKTTASFQDEATQAVAGLLPQQANAAAPKYSPLKVNINPNLNVEIRVSGDCKGDNSRRTGADGSITFPNCTTGNHTVTVDNQATKDGKTYKVQGNSKQVNVPNQGAGNVTFTYNQLSTGGGAGGTGGAGGGTGGSGGGGGSQNGDRGQVKVNLNPNLNTAIKISGDCQGDNIRNTGPDGSITFKNCAPGKHTVTVDKTVIDKGQKYKVKDPAQTVTVKKGGTENVTFKYEKSETVGEDLQGSVNAFGNIRLDCGNVRIIQIYPRDKQVIGHLKIIKFEDKNGNGKEDKGEPRLKNIQFKIDGVGLFETDKNGEVEIKNLDPDAYSVKEVQTIATEAYTSTTKDIQRANVKANKTATVKFGNKLKENTGKIKIVKFEDKNGNGTQDQGEGPLKDVAFKVEGYGTFKTNDRGVINVKNIPVGKQVKVTELTESLSAGATDATATAVAEEDTADTTADNSNAANGKGNNKKQTKSAPATTDTAGQKTYGGIPTITVNGVVYASSAEFNKKTQENAATPGMVCFYVNPDKGNGQGDVMCATKDTWYSVGSTVRDDSKATKKFPFCYRTADLKGGKADDFTICFQKKSDDISHGRGYSIQIVTPEKYANLMKQAGIAAPQAKSAGADKDEQPTPTPTVAADSLAAATVTDSEAEDTVVASELQDGVTYKPTTPTTQTATSAATPKPVLFGNQPQVQAQAGALLVGKALDVNGDGKPDANDQPQEGIEFEVTGPNDFNETIVTNPLGLAAIGGLAPGQYTVTEKVPVGFTALTLTQNVTVVANQIASAPFLNQPVGASGGLLIGKAVDANGDGKIDTNDTPQANVTFTVSGPDGFTQTVVTGANGFAALGGLKPGEYSIEEQLPAGYKVASTNPQKVTVVANQIASAPFLNQYICTPSPQVSPGQSPAPAPTCVPSPTPSPTPGGSITQAFGNLPKTGQAGLVLLATFLTAAGLYYGNKYRRNHQAK